MSDPLIVTLGCRLNAYESEVMRRHVSDAKLDDCVIVNTCAVTAEAVRKAEQAVRKLRRDRPTARLIVTGCAAQIEPKRFAAIEGVDHVIGNGEKLEAKTFQALAADTLERVVVNDIMSVKANAPHLIDGFDSHARAFVQVQNGCDHRCTFCIIPLGRGPSRSVPAGEVVSQIRKLAEHGYAEVVLTGVDITSYGADLPGRMSLGRLVKQILAHVPELRRLRLSSIDQVETDEHLLEAIATDQRLMPHLHLSMQAGDDMILKRMKRRHLRDDAIRFCETVRSLRPDVVFGADFIAGFPTETDAMFQNTLNLVEDCGLTYLHVFPFSPREGTPAARMPQVDRRAVKERATRLRDKGDARLAQFLDRLQGSRTEIVVERGNIGRTPQFAAVDIDRDVPVGAIRWATLGPNDGRRITGMIDA